MNPLAIDLFCGLFQTQLMFSADATIKQFMASWAKQPDHVTLSI